MEILSYILQSIWYSAIGIATRFGIYDILRMPTMGKIGKKWCFSRPKVAQDS